MAVIKKNKCRWTQMPSLVKRSCWNIYTHSSSPIDHLILSHRLCRWMCRSESLSLVWAVERFSQWTRFQLDGVEGSRTGIMRGSASNSRITVKTRLTLETAYWVTLEPGFKVSLRLQHNDYSFWGEHCVSNTDSRNWVNKWLHILLWMWNI